MKGSSHFKCLNALSAKWAYFPFLVTNIGVSLSGLNFCRLVSEVSFRIRRFIRDPLSEFCELETNLAFFSLKFKFELNTGDFASQNLE